MKNILLKKEYIFNGNLILVNRKYCINKIKEKSLLVPFSNAYSNILFDTNANIKLQELLDKIKSGNSIVPVSAYRSLEQQQIWDDSLKENGEKFTKQYVAYPNCSEHQTGLAIDLALNQENIDFICPAFPYKGICQEFRDNMTEYGFISRYTKAKEEITNISSEEWHFRYVGYPHSKIMKERDLCLEEYIDFLRNFRFGNNYLNFQDYDISYIKMDDDIKEIEINDEEQVTISGNNVDGIIVTRRKNGKK